MSGEDGLHEAKEGGEFVVFVGGLWATVWLTVWWSPGAVMGLTGLIGVTGLVLGMAPTAAAAMWATGRRRALLCGVIVGLVVVAGHGMADEDRGRALRQRIAAAEEGRLRAVFEGRVVSGPHVHRRGWSLAVAIASIDGEPVSATGRKRVGRSDDGRVRLFMAGRPLEMARAGLPLPGDRISFFGRLERYPAPRFPGRVGWRRRMRARGVVARGVVRGEVDTLKEGAGWRRPLARTRVAFQTGLIERLEPDRAAVALALTTGARGLLAPSTSEPYRRTGTGHLLAISGLHLGVLAGILWWLAGLVANRFPRFIGRWGRRRVCGAAVVALLGAYVLMVGAPTSAVRAWVMVAAAVASLAAMRAGSGFHALAAAALVAILWRPSVVAEMGFQLSFAATAAILGFLAHRPAILESPRRSGRRMEPLPTEEPPWQRRARQVGLAVGVSLSATLATWPVVAAWTGRIAVCGLWLNVVVTPIFGALVFPVIAVGAVVGQIWAPPGDPLVRWAAEAMIRAADGLDAVAGWSGSVATVGAVPPWAAVVAMAGVALLVLGRLRRDRVIVGLVLLVAGLGVGPGGPLVTSIGGDGLQVDYLPVGQGDASLVRTSGGATVLIDGGGSRLGADPGRTVVVPHLRRLGVGRLDWVVITHADIDHVGGLLAVVRHMRPRHLVYDARERSPYLARVVRAARRAGARLHPLDVGAPFVERIGGAEVRIRRPGPGGHTTHGAHRDQGDNDASLVTTVSFAGRRLLFPGDIEVASERWLARRLGAPVDVTLVPHHGSRTSSSRRFLRAAAPRFAVVSAGRHNAFGHPHPTVLRRYRARRIPVFSTARHGLVRVRVARDGRLHIRARREMRGDMD